MRRETQQHDKGTTVNIDKHPSTDAARRRFTSYESSSIRTVALCICLCPSVVSGPFCGLALLPLPLRLVL